MSDIAIKAENISKLYHIGMKSNGSFRETMTNSFKSLIGRKSEKEDPTEFWALKDISFDIKKGDSVGIIGKNGAGKSTLLKVLSRITEPTTGKITINGRIASLLEVGTGFHPELTGRENIFLNGSILGMNRKEIQSKFDEIVDFSGIEKFMDTPVKRYSSGMYVRLAFSVAAHLEPEILIIDEVLAVGDAEFQNKCLGKMEDVSLNQGRTVLFVSHNLGSVLSLCSKAILLSSGQIIENGNVKNVIETYKKLQIANTIYENNSTNRIIRKCVLTDSNGIAINSISFNQSIYIEIDLKEIGFDKSTVLGIALLDPLKNRVFTDYQYLSTLKRNENGLSCKIKFQSGIIAPGNYSFLFAIVNYSNGHVYELLDDVLSFSIYDTGTKFKKFEGEFYGSIIIDSQWE